MVEVEVPIQFSSDNDPVLINNVRLLLIEDPYDYNNIFIILLIDVTITQEKHDMNTAVMLVLLVPGMDASWLLTGKATRNLLNATFSSAPKFTQIYNNLQLQETSETEKDNAGNSKSESLNPKSNDSSDVSQSIIPLSQPVNCPFPELIIRANDGLKHNSPEACSEGVNGTYFLKDENGNTIFVFKPEDEEGNNSPKRENEENIIPTSGIKEGEAALREVAAFLLDSEGFCGVPKTHMVSIQHHFQKPKTGSLQEFIENDGNADDFGPRVFPVREVHKIGVLDVQILNFDRHAGNILVKKNEAPNTIELVPIDHGFSLPDNLEVPWFEWMHWPQAKIPFDDEVKSCINRIDIKKNAELLQTLGVRKECIKNMEISTKLLKKAVAYNKTLYEIGKILCRDFLTPDEPSHLERFCEKAKNSVGMESSEEEFFSCLDLVMDEFMSK